MKLGWIIAGASLGALGLGAQEGPSIQAVRASSPVKLDGHLREAAWGAAPPLRTAFAQVWPEYGKPSPLETEVRVVYDEHHLYVAARMHHPEGRAQVIRRLHRRDQDSQSDWFTVFIDSLRDRRTAWGFGVNAAGVQRDTLHVGDQMGGDASWDGVWESAVSVDGSGWTAELKIPLSLLRIQPGGGAQTWGINFSRSDQGPIRGSSYWALAPRGTNAFVGYFPSLTGLEGLLPHPRREFLPYVSTQRKFETARPYDDRGWTHRAGLDARLGLTSASQLDLTVNPDFGQVEVDQAVLNLGTYETFFQEKRPFFLEGMELFQVAGNNLFYSRRIGRGLWDPDLEEGEALRDRPQAADITAAAKYTGKFGNGFQIGLLGANVGVAKADVLTTAGEVEQRELLPMTNFGVLRAQQVLDETGSYVGVFGGLVRQAGPTGRTAQVQAVDTVLKSRDRSTTLEATVARTQAGDPGEQASGFRERLRLNRQWKSGWTADLVLLNTDRDFNPNDMGFMNRPDERIASATVTRRWDHTWGALRNWEWGAWAQDSRNQEGRAFQRVVNTWFKTDFTNFFSFRAEVGLHLPEEDDRELRTFWDAERKYLRVERRPWVELGFDTPGNRPWYVRGSLDRTWNPEGPSTGFSLYQSIKLNSALEVQLDSRISRDEGLLRYLETRGETPVVGVRAMSQFNQTMRVAYAFSPTLSLQLFTQLMAANWSFRDLQAYVDDRTLAPASVGDSATAFSDRIWNLNVIGRWEFRPGSTAFLVYTRGVWTDRLINDRASLSPRNDLPLLRHLPSDDAVQVKFSWLFR
ncbi:MAG TPA: DUF5916 domain-containing protein [Holophaga sp.]|nr:DUF5916 domain-containing protein [Holophaga sp.]